MADWPKIYADTSLLANASRYQHCALERGRLSTTVADGLAWYKPIIKTWDHYRIHEEYDTCATKNRYATAVGMLYAWAAEAYDVEKNTATAMGHESPE